MNVTRMTLLALLLALCGDLGAQEPAAPARTRPWPKDLVERAARIAVQDGGRVKPLLTVASYAMLRINGKRSAKVTVVGANGAAVDLRLGPVDWLLDCLFFPEQARRYPVFLIEDWDVLDHLEVPREEGKRRRDRYSYDDLLPAVDRLQELWQRYGVIEEGKRTPLQGHVVRLAQNFMEFSALTRFLEFADMEFRPAELGVLKDRFPAAESLTFSQVLAEVPDLLLEYHVQIQEAAETGAEPPAAVRELSRIFDFINAGVSRWDAIALFPAPAKEAVWLTPADVVARTLAGEAAVEPYVGLLARLERLHGARGEPQAFGQQFTALSSELEAMATRRGEYGEIALEVAYHRADLFFWAEVLFFFGFLVTVVFWLTPRTAWLYQLSRWWLLPPSLLAVIGITMRCVIRGRPPVSTLYETMIIVAAVIGLVALIVEFVNRLGVAALVGHIGGVLGLRLAAWFETVDRVDTMPSLQAVLDTNFWLTVHVQTITVGYAAGFFAAALANVYVLGRLFGLRRNEPEFYQSVARMVYGAIAFCLIFSVVGTITGGVWANESWGRFWGWDPKENGALMICLGTLIILHLRTGGYLREPGVAAAAVVLGIVIIFSWFHVNHLNVGLHTYGKIRAIGTVFNTYYWVQGTVAALGVLVAVRERLRQAGVA